MTESWRYDIKSPFRAVANWLASLLPGRPEDDAWIWELWEGYQALADAIDLEDADETSYAFGYLDGWENATYHAGWADQGRRVPAADAFPFLTDDDTRCRAIENLRDIRTRRHQ